MKKQPEQLTVAEMINLTTIINFCMEGSYHGYQTEESWKLNKQILVSFLERKGYEPHGEWTLGLK